MACCWCGSSVEEGEHLTLDHFVPVSKGGTNEADNLLTSCRRCNSARGNRSAEEFAQAVAQYYLGAQLQNLSAPNSPEAESLMAYINGQLLCPIDGHRKDAKKIIARRREAA